MVQKCNKVQAKYGKVTQNMHGASRHYRYVWDVSGSLIWDAPTRKTIEWTNSVSTRGASVCSGGVPFARSLCLVSLCKYSLEHFSVWAIKHSNLPRVLQVA